MYRLIAGILLFFLIASGSLYAQTDAEILRYSRSFYGGTARFHGLGGAMGALGADFSAVNINPAGLGVYRRPEFVITPAMVNVRNRSTFLGNTVNDSKYNFNINSLGYVGHLMMGGEQGWMALNISIGYNKENNFHRSVTFQGVNEDHSLLDRYLEDINNNNGGTAPSDIYPNFPFGAGLAYDAYLINPLPNDTFHHSSVIPNAGIRQRQTLVSRGTINDWNISVAANRNNRYYIGASLGIPYLRYSQESNYQEIDFMDSIPGFRSFSLNEDLTTTGYGVYMKLGLIMRLSEKMRLGGSIKTSTVYYLKDQFSSTLRSDLEGFGKETGESPSGRFNYLMRTPWKATANAAWVDKRGFVSVDYEFVDYSLMNVDFGKESTNTEDKFAGIELNETIRGKYGVTHNFRVGAELRLLQNVAVRGGFAYYPSPFKDPDDPKIGADYAKTTASVGAGTRTDDFALDVALVRSHTGDFYAPYSVSTDNSLFGAQNSITEYMFLVTLGFRID